MSFMFRNENPSEEKQAPSSARSLLALCLNRLKAEKWNLFSFTFFFSLPPLPFLLFLFTWYNNRFLHSTNMLSREHMHKPFHCRPFHRLKVCLEPVPGSGSKRDPAQSCCKSDAPDLKIRYSKYTRNRAGLKPKPVEVLREQAAVQNHGWQSFQPTHTCCINRRPNGAGPASSVISKLGEVERAHTPAASLGR